MVKAPPRACELFGGGGLSFCRTCYNLVRARVDAPQGPSSPCLGPDDLAPPSWSSRCRASQRPRQDEALFFRFRGTSVMCSLYRLATLPRMFGDDLKSTCRVARAQPARERSRQPRPDAGGALLRTDFGKTMLYPSQGTGGEAQIFGLCKTILPCQRASRSRCAAAPGPGLLRPSSSRSRSRPGFARLRTSDFQGHRLSSARLLEHLLLPRARGRTGRWPKTTHVGNGSAGTRLRLRMRACWFQSLPPLERMSCLQPLMTHS